MKSKPGTYAIVMRCDRKVTVQVGKVGQVSLMPGFYVYVGSAFGPGGVRARVGRHVKKSRLKGGLKPHWHIDYILPYMDVTDVWYTYDPVRREDEWVAALGNAHGFTIPLEGFGATDCGCKGHLFYFVELNRWDPSLLSRGGSGEFTDMLKHMAL